MDLQKFDEYLKNRYYNQLFYYKGASSKNQKYYKNFQWTLIIVSTITTILAALPRSDNFNVQYVLVVTAALVTILTAGLKTFQYQELWISYRVTAEQLKPEIFYYEFNVGDYGEAGVDKENLFVTRVEGILSKEHESWPMFKELVSKEGKQKVEDLQKKLDDLAREKFNTQKPVPTNEIQVTDENNSGAENEPGSDSNDTNEPEVTNEKFENDDAVTPDNDGSEKDQPGG